MTDDSKVLTAGPLLVSAMPGELLRYEGHSDDPGPDDTIYSVVRNGEESRTLYRGRLVPSGAGQWLTPRIEEIGTMGLLALLRRLMELGICEALDPWEETTPVPRGLDHQSLTDIYSMLVEECAPGWFLGRREVMTGHGVDLGVCSISPTSGARWTLSWGPCVDPMLMDFTMVEALVKGRYLQWEERDSSDDDGVCKMLDDAGYDPSEVLVKCRDDYPPLAGVIRRGLRVKPAPQPSTYRR